MRLIRLSDDVKIPLVANGMHNYGVKSFLLPRALHAPG